MDSRPVHWCDFIDGDEANGSNNFDHTCIIITVIIF